MVETHDDLISEGPFVVFRWRNSPAWQLEYVSKNLTTLFGYNCNDLLSGAIHYGDLIHPDDLATASRAVGEAARRDEESFEQEYRIRNRQGAFIWVRDFTRMVHDKRGTITHYQSYIWEITRQKEAESKLQALNRSQQARIERALEAIREQDAALIAQSRHAALGESISNIAHQWRQPLNALAILIQDLEDAYAHGELDRKQLDEVISRSMVLINYLSTTIDDFRNFYRADRQMSSFCPTEAVEKALALLEGAFQSHAIAVRRHYEADLPNILGHPNRFAQAVVNLFNNAKDAIVAHNPEAGTITVTLQRHPEGIALTVEDNGGGIEPEAIGRIFDPYFTTKHPSQGTGVGLYMTRIIIERNMGGTIRAENCENGARFVICLPLKPPEMIAA